MLARIAPFVPRPLRRVLRWGINTLVKPPRQTVERLLWLSRGTRFGGRLAPVSPSAPASAAPPEPDQNPLQRYVNGVTEGPGIWKWQHYLDIYHRHFAKFVGRPVNILEIGIYSGGSLSMWRSYFGDRCHVFGVDIEPSCRAYETDGITVLIGDQADPAFWRRVRDEIPPLDIIVDDGGHLVHQQAVTLEETLAYLRPGGVYLCEDIHGIWNPFHLYVCGLARHLHASRTETNPDNPERRIVVHASPLQTAIHSVHIYPFVTVIERTEHAVAELVSPKRGTQWQPFGDAWNSPTPLNPADGARADAAAAGR